MTMFIFGAIAGANIVLAAGIIFGLIISKKGDK